MEYSFESTEQKEEDNVMKLMAAYGALTPIEGGKTQRSVTRRNGQRKNVSFNYTEPLYNHFKYRHQVDNHNNLRHSPLSFEESINTKDWKLRVFTFVMALIEVNVGLAVAYFTGRGRPNESTGILSQTCKGADCFLPDIENRREEQLKASF